MEPFTRFVFLKRERSFLHENFNWNEFCHFNCFTNDASFSSSLLLRKAFNSLFHFPDDFLKPPTNISSDNSKSVNEKVPQNVLIVTSITESDEIYSVSDNSKEIINRNLNDLISLKMSTTFPRVLNNDDDYEVEFDESSQIREFSINDKKKKTFRFSTERIGCLTKTVMVEENSREKNYMQRLNAFLPPYFADMHGKTINLNSITKMFS